MSRKRSIDSASSVPMEEAPRKRFHGMLSWKTNELGHNKNMLVNPYGIEHHPNSSTFLGQQTQSTMPLVDAHNIPFSQDNTLSVTDVTNEEFPYGMRPAENNVSPDVLSPSCSASSFSADCSPYRSLSCDNTVIIEELPDDTPMDITMPDNVNGGVQHVSDSVMTDDIQKPVCNNNNELVVYRPLVPVTTIQNPIAPFSVHQAFSRLPTHFTPNEWFLTKEMEVPLTHKRQLPIIPNVNVFTERPVKRQRDAHMPEDDTTSDRRKMYYGFPAGSGMDVIESEVSAAPPMQFNVFGRYARPAILPSPQGVSQFMEMSSMA